jgi:proteasome lid subunit RPN8/RPN11
MIVEIASRVRETLLAEAVAAAGEECCGLLLGTPGRIAAIVPARNVAADPARSFEIDPATLLRTHREARGRGEQVIGHYHSHPDGQPEPSLRDAARAVGNGDIWLIIAAGTINAWGVVGTDPGGSAVHGRFLPVTLHSPPVAA